MNNINSQSWRKGLILSATFLIGLFVAVGCKKKDHTLGQDTIDQNDLLSSGGVDTFSLTTFTIVEDSVITDNPANGILGQYNDPEFGIMNSEIYTQIRLVGVDPNFGDPTGITVDSIVLRLEYSGLYGETSDQYIEVFEITEDLSIDSTYYSFTTFTNAGTDLVKAGENMVTMDVNTLSVVGNDTVSPQLRIPLDNTLGQRFIQDAWDTPSIFNDNAEFVDYFKGLYVRSTTAPASGDGGVFYFDMNDPNSKVTLYYTNGTGDKKEFDFVINSECADFNHVDVDNSMTNVQTVINDTISGMQEFYAQSFKSRAVVQIPGLSNIPANAVIHRATLTLPVQYQTASIYDPGDLLIVSTRLSQGDNKLYSIGQLAEFSVYSKAFTVDLREYVQSIILGDVENTELVFSPFFFISSGNRIIFNGQQTNNKVQPKLEIVYTEF